MALLYVNENNASLNRSPVADGETIVEGEFITQNDDGTVSAFDPANDGLPIGIVVHDPEGDSIAEHDEDYTSYGDLWTYDGSEGDTLYWQPLASVDNIMPRSISEETDANGNTPPEPSFGEGNVIGVIVGPSGETRVVPSGYTYDANDDGTAETFSESGSGDFVAIGRLDKYPQDLRFQSEYDQRIPIRLDSDVFTLSTYGA